MTFAELEARWRDMVETDYGFIVQAIELARKAPEGSDDQLAGHDAIRMVKEGR